MHDGPYSGHDERRAQESRDAGMISEDHSAIANLPQGVVMREYPKMPGTMPEGLNDKISGVDTQINLDNSQKSKHMSPKKV